MAAALAKEEPTAETIFRGELAQHGYWVVACVEPQFPWPTSVQKIIYRGHALFMLPQFGDYYPSVVVQQGKGLGTFEEAQVLILNFLSALSWVEEQGALVEFWSGGNRPRPFAGFSRSGFRMVLTDHFDCHYLPEAIDQHARWALAFFREGLAIRQVAYAFLSFYKIINILHHGGANQKAWINNKVDAASTYRSQERLQKLRAEGVDVGHYLYESGRCAVAHAGQGPTIDPENPGDLKRLSHDLPLMRDLATHAIETEFGVKSAGTVYREHLYELDGFRNHVTEALCQSLKDGADVQLSEFPALPNFHIGLYGEENFPPLCNLAAKVTAIEKGVVRLECSSAEGRTRMVLLLDFPNERLRLNPIDGILSLDDGSEAAIRDAIAVMCFKKAFFANGQLTVANALTGECLGRCDAFLPVNVDLSGTLRDFDAIIAEWEQIANQRAGKL